MIRFVELSRTGSEYWGSDTSGLHRGFYPFRWGKYRDVVEGRRSMVLPGVFVRNDAQTELGIWVGWNNVKYVETNVMPSGYSTSHWFVRAEYTRSTRPRVQPQRPRFGLRYGGAMTFGDGTMSSAGRWTAVYGNGYSEKYLKSNVLLLQGSIWFGYRSAGFNAGVQWYLNLAAWVWGDYRNAGWDRIGLDEREWDRKSHFNTFVLADKLVQEGLFSSYFQFVVSVPLVRIGKAKDTPPKEGMSYR